MQIVRDLQDNIGILKAYKRMFQYVPRPPVIHMAVDNQRADAVDALFDEPEACEKAKEIRRAISQTLCGQNVLPAYVVGDSKDMDKVQCPLCLVKYKEIHDLMLSLLKE